MKGKAAVPMLAVHDADGAIDFYCKVFGATETSRMVTDEGKIEHAQIKVGDASIMIADEFPEHNHAARSLGGTPVIIYLYVDDVDAVVQRALGEGSKVLREPQNQPHGDRVAKIEDPFEHVWMLASPLS